MNSMEKLVTQGDTESGINFNGRHPLKSFMYQNFFIRP